MSKWVCKKLMPPPPKKKEIKGLGKIKPTWKSWKKLNNQNPEKGLIGPHTSA